MKTNSAEVDFITMLQLNNGSDIIFWSFELTKTQMLSTPSIWKKAFGRIHTLVFYMRILLQSDFNYSE